MENVLDLSYVVHEVLDGALCTHLEALPIGWRDIIASAPLFDFLSAEFLSCFCLVQSL